MKPLLLGGPDEPSYIPHFVTPGGLVVAAACDAGFGYKNGVNEDRVIITHDYTSGADIIMGLDGMGGTDDGEAAAEAVVLSLLKHPENMDEALTYAKEIIPRANHEQAAGVAINGSKITGQGGVRHLENVQAGDVKRVRLRLRGLLNGEQGPVQWDESDDENVAAALYRLGTLTLEESRKSRYRHVLQNFISADLCKPTKTTLEATSGDRLLWMSDGVTENVGDEIINLARQGTASQVLSTLWQLVETNMKNCDARRAMGLNAKKDNRLLIVADVP